VFNRVHKRFDAQFVSSDISPDALGIELRKAARWYNDAWATPETNNAGWSALTEMKGYRRLYLRGESQDERAHRALNRYGWKTTAENRDWLLDQYIKACRPNLITGFEDSILVLSPELVAQERTFIKGARRRDHLPGKHDDAIFAASICWMLHLQCPRTLPEPPKAPRNPYAVPTVAEVIAASEAGRGTNLDRWGGRG
jgi:hypothetical protein